MTERHLKIPNQNLSLPKNCSSPDVIAVIYLIKPGDTVQKAKIFDIKCQNVKCPVNNCRYKEINSL